MTIRKTSLRARLSAFAKSIGELVHGHMTRYMGSQGLILYADDPNGGGGGGAGGVDPKDPAVAALIQAAVDREVTGLKNKNTELINSNKEIKTKFEELSGQFAGFDIDAVKGLLTKAKTDEETKLIAEGKIDEVITRRTERMQQDFQKKEGTWAEESKRKDQTIQKLKAGKVAGALTAAASKAGARAEAMEDVVLRGGNTWTVDDEGDVVAMNGEEVVLGKDGKTPLTPAEWVESLRETAPHLWPPAQGSGAPGNNGRMPSGVDLSKLSPVQRINEARKAGGKR